MIAEYGTDETIGDPNRAAAKLFVMSSGCALHSKIMKIFAMEVTPYCFEHRFETERSNKKEDD